MSNHPFWSFSHFTSEIFKYRESWDRDNPILRQELLQIAHNYDPLHGYRHITRNATNFGSQNSWYTYMRTLRFDFNPNLWEERTSSSWNIEVHPTAENTDKPFHKPHHIFVVMMPEEFLNDEIFMAENTKEHDEVKEAPSVLVGANITL